MRFCFLPQGFNVQISISILVSTTEEKLLANDTEIWKTTQERKFLEIRFQDFSATGHLFHREALELLSAIFLGPAWHRQLFHSPQEVNLEEESPVHKNP